VLTDKKIIEQTEKWITDVVIGCNFCPFAAKAVKQQQVHYCVEQSSDAAACLYTFLQEAIRLDADEAIETSLIIFPNAFKTFTSYLQSVTVAESLLKQNGYEGIYQVASFHPQYCFANSTEDDAANYTNRSIYPMLHLLREASIDKALLHYKNPENIPNVNINFARQKGLVQMQLLRAACM
jgi:uncharacterized protein